MRKSLSIITIALAILLTPIAAFADDAATNAGSSRPVININSADASQLALLPRVGPKAAERIVAYRKDNGQFKKTTDLMQVKGIGDKTFEMLSPYLVLEGKTTLSAKQHGPSRGKRAKTPAPQAQ